MPIKNINYRKFLDEGIITTIGEDKLRKAMENIKKSRTKFQSEARSLLISLYLSGARPNEVLRIKAKDVVKDGRYIKLVLKASKGGLPRTLSFLSSNTLADELWQYAQHMFPDMLIFFHFIGRYKRVKYNKKGVKKEIIEITDRVRYFVGRWFSGVIDGSISPYFLRHNRWSKLSERGVPMMELKAMKGARSIESVYPYIHMSSDISKKNAKKFD